LTDKTSPPSVWFRRLKVPVHAVPWSIKLAGMTRYERNFHFSRVLSYGLPAIQRSGVKRVPRKNTEATISLDVDLTVGDYLELERARLQFACNMTSLVQSIYDQTESVARASLETEYIRRGLPGDPSTLSDRVLHTWLNDEVPSSLRDALADLTTQTSHLQKRVDAFNWMNSVLLASLLFQSSPDTLSRFGMSIGIPEGETSVDEILKRLGKYFS
jgi:hypothetical protein